MHEYHFDDMVACKKCKKKQAYVFKYTDDMYYALCPCKKWNQNEFLGYRADLAKEKWNKINSYGEKGAKK